VIVSIPVEAGVAHAGRTRAVTESRMPITTRIRADLKSRYSVRALVGSAV
jgi:hypothetical protein